MNNPRRLTCPLTPPLSQPFLQLQPPVGPKTLTRKPSFASSAMQHYGIAKNGSPTSFITTPPTSTNARIARKQQPPSRIVRSEAASIVATSPTVKNTPDICISSTRRCAAYFARPSFAGLEDENYSIITSRPFAQTRRT